MALTDNRKKLSEYNVKDGAGLSFKDLGPQIGYQATFFIEYFGPILFYPALYYFGRDVYGVSAAPTTVQTLALWLGVLHFVKRELETAFVHRFSHGTMPVSSCVRNCLHYWVLGGLFMGYFVFYPGNTSGVTDPTTVKSLVAVWALAELGNLYTHLYLRSLRPANSTVRKVPRGFGFSLVSCPNYFFEVLGWVAFSVLVGHWSAWLFTVVGAAQMMQWADKKHREYKRDFADYPKGRKRMIPFVW